jgi:hypothetical protein
MLWYVFFMMLRPILLEFICRPVSWLPTNKAFAFFFIVFMFVCDKLTSVNQKLMCPIHFASILVFLGVPNGML